MDKISSRRQVPDAGDEIVISGISGRFPKSRNVAELAHRLYNKIDSVDASGNRWPNFHPEIPFRMGTIEDIEKFDATFFGVAAKQANTMDPQSRLLIETAYEAIVDAGICPKSLRGSRTGVYIGACFSESERLFFYDRSTQGGLGITGCSRAMLANRISYCLNLKGPSFLVDTACSSSMYALDVAFSALMNGECDAALVGGSNLLLHPYISLQFARLGVLTKDGYCRPFDNQASGYTRSEAVCVMLLQKARDAKRIYANLLYSKTNCDGFKPEGITYPSGVIQEKLLTEFYRDINIDPRIINYVEAHSTGTQVGDPEECRALDHVFCTNRDKPLLVGSIKSNIGHSEATSGACSIVKMILAFESGLVPPNLNFVKAKNDIPALVENRLVVCTEPTPLEGNLIAINAFGFGGANAHVLFSCNPKTKQNNGLPLDDLPRLVNWAGRTREAVDHFLDSLEAMPLDAEFIGLLHNIQSENISGNVYRGFTLLKKNEILPQVKSNCLGRAAKYQDGVKRPIVWMFSGMGSQWTSMGKSLMTIPHFLNSITECHKLLQPLGVDLYKVLTSTDERVFDHIINSFVGIAAIQIGLVNLLRLLNIPMDFCIGHSVGELGCSYADGSFTVEQMLYAAYARGLVSYKAKVIEGSMAAIGLGYVQIKAILPSTIKVACHNNAQSCTISGPKTEIAAFVVTMKQQGIFAKEVRCSNIPYHSEYISEMGPKLFKKLRNIIPSPRRRSSKWLSTSVPSSELVLEANQFSSPEYHTNNLLKPVLFEETVERLPQDAIVLEIAPHGLLQAIIKKSMPKAIHIPLTQRGHANNCEFLFAALGKIFINGFMMAIDRLYPAVEFPVSRGTPMISSLLEWDHSEDWFVAKFEFQQDCKSGERRVTISLDECPSISGHVIDGRSLVPATHYIELVWETYSMMTSGPIYSNINVEFEDLCFLRATALNENQKIDLTIIIHHGSGCFEVSESSTPVVTGVVRSMEPSDSINDIKYRCNHSDTIVLDGENFYKELHLRGYQYEGMFRSVVEASDDVSFAKIKWKDNWTVLMDAMLQINIIAMDTRQLYLPTRIRKIRISGAKHLALVKNNDLLDAAFYPELRMIKCGGIEIIDMAASSVVRRRQAGIEVYNRYEFIPLTPEFELSITDILHVMTQLILENSLVTTVSILENHDSCTEPTIGLYLDVIRQVPIAKMKLTLCSDLDLEIDNVEVRKRSTNLQNTEKHLLTIQANCLQQLDDIKDTWDNIDEGCFLLSRESKRAIDISNVPAEFVIISRLYSKSETFVLLRKKKREPQKERTVMMISSEDNSYDWVISLKNSLKVGPVMLVAMNDKYSGLIGLINCLRREGYDVVGFIVNDSLAPDFDIVHSKYSTQISLGLTINVNRNGSWGTYRFLSLDRPTKSSPHSGHVYANVHRIGDLSSFQWYEGELNISPTKHMVNIHYSSINFRDVMLATARLPADIVIDNRLSQYILGFEYSGVDANGDRVMGMTSLGALSTQVQSIEYATWKIPPDISMREAATIPVAYITVYYAFFLNNRISSGKSILIHAGSGAVGLAAIRVALAYGMEVFTTVSNDDKKSFILELFPDLKEANIGNSRNCSFEEMIFMRTGGKGVDYILNSLSGDKLQASLRCLARGGCFIEIGKFDIVNNSAMGMAVFAKETTFRSVFADNLRWNPFERKIIYDLMEDDLRKGIIKPLHSTVFEVEEIENAFRYLGTGKHVGKVMIRMRDEANPKCSVPLIVQQKVFCNANKVYIILGGLGGFGLELADWLMLRGARRLVLSSRRGISNSYQAFRIRSWEKYGCRVDINTADIITFEGSESLLKAAMAGGPIGGIFNLAAVLSDSMFDNQSQSTFAECAAPKVTATLILDELTRKLCPQLEQFVTFSSASCGLGNAGQSNYGLANSVMERIIEHRVRDGFPGKVIQWGAVGDVGLVALMLQDKLADTEIAGTVPQRIASCLAALDSLLTSSNSIVSSMVLPEKQFGNSTQQSKVSIISSVLNIMGIRDLKSVSPVATLAELGMDSLMSVEIKQILEREFDVFLTPQELRMMTFANFEQLSNKGEPGEKNEIPLKTSGLNIIFNCFGDEQTSDIDLLELKTAYQGTDPVRPTCLVIPGIEGVASASWKILSKDLDFPATILQLTRSLEGETIEDIIAPFLVQIKSLFSRQKHFNIIAHSFGALIALELARTLEVTGQTGNILLLDGAPHYIQRTGLGIIKASSKNINEDIENALILTMFQKLCAGKVIDAFIEDLAQSADWFCKVNLIVKFLPQDLKVTYSEAYLRKITLAVLNRTKAFINYSNSHGEDVFKQSKLKSRITLVRPSLVSIKDIADDYELSQFTERPVDVRVINGDHFKMLENSELTVMINHFLSDQ